MSSSNNTFRNKKIESIKERITSFQQMASESLFDAWERYKALLWSCPCHGYSNYTQISLFIKRTTHEYRRMINALTRGYYVNGTTTKVNKIIKDEELVNKAVIAIAPLQRTFPKKTQKMNSSNKKHKWKLWWMLWRRT